MDNNEIKKLCLNLMNAKNSLEVVELLKNKNLWDDKTLWKNYGNKEGSYVGQSNWTNFYTWFTHQSIYTLKKDELLMYQEDTNVKKAA